MVVLSEPDLRHGSVNYKTPLPVTLEYDTLPGSNVGHNVLSTSGHHQSHKAIEHVVQGIEWPQNITPDSAIRVSWAILLSHYGESSDVIFENTISPGNERQALEAERRAAGTFVTIPIRAAIEGNETLQQLEQQILQNAIDSMPDAYTKLQNTSHVNNEDNHDWHTRSLLVVSSVEAADNEDQDALSSFCRAVVGSKSTTSEVPTKKAAIGHNADMTKVRVSDKYALSLHCQAEPASLLVKMAFTTNTLSHRVASRIINHFDHMLRLVLQANVATTKVNDLDMMSAYDLRQVWEWNARVPESIDGCVHELISESVHRYPHSLAVSAWDGELTYQEMDSLSTQLAYQLIHMGVGNGDVLTLCFEKSMWMPVTQLAVMKAGAASMAVDPSQPKERIKIMIETVESRLILCAPATTSLVSLITERKQLVVQHDTIRDFMDQVDEDSFVAMLPSVKPSDLLYVLFTSGTTGIPKGAMVTHSNFTSAVHLQRDLLHIESASRVANFCSYAWDVAWSDLIHTLAAGACLCIPSEYQRKHDLVDFMIRKQVTWVELTPSVAAILELNTVSTLRTVILLGELVDFDKLPHLDTIENTIITYGPTECTVTTTGVVRTADTAKASIGWACGSKTWIVDPNKDSLTSVGLIGELVIEGPLVGRGYINNAEKTTAAFIDDPAWLLRGGPGVEGRHGRLYRSGDLVRYNDDGQLIYVGRKDTQVKINGHRTELGEVEHHVYRILQTTPEVTGVFAEVVTPKVTQHKILVAFLLMPRVDANELEEKAKSIIATLEKELSKGIPSYMIPTLYIPVTEIPITLNGKTDRRALREIGAGLDIKALASLNGATGTTECVQPTTEAEIQLRNLWAMVLNLVVSAIGVEDNFVHLGGDSLAAMRLVAAARKQGRRLTVPDIFSQPRLREMATVMSQSETAPKHTEPFSLLKAEIGRVEACRRVAEACAVGSLPLDQWRIEDILPCTALQEGLLAMTAKNPSKYVSCQIAELKPDVDLDRFQRAWQRVSERASILRTRIVDLPGQGLVQVVLHEPLEWQTFSSLAEFRNKDLATETLMGLGTPLSRLAIINGERSKKYFAWTQHHATYDGWSLPMLVKEVENAYRDEYAKSSSLPLQDFVKYVVEQRGEDGAHFWRQQFAGLEATQFPSIPEKAYQPKADKIINHSISNIHWPTCGVTPSSSLRTAWATLLSWYVDSSDVSFGVVVSGRQALVTGIEDIAGPTIATVPVRVQVQGTVDGLLKQVQQQAMEMVPFEQYGLQHIRQINQDAKNACDFQTLLLIHPPAEKNSLGSQIFDSRLDEQEGPASENTYAMMLTCQLSASGVQLRLSFDSVLVKEGFAVRLLQQLEHVLRQLGSVPGSTEMNYLNRVSEQDLRDLWDWNAAVPQSVNKCVHELFAERVAETPNAIAICAWDGELTYRQLDKASTLLANHLANSELKVGPGTIVPLYFEKSMWVPVAILAVMRAGGASVALDATLPQARLKSIVSQLSASVILTSKSCQKLAAAITDAAVVEVSRTSDALRQSQTIRPLPRISPSSPLYIVFTSGSTGAPKGATITHANFCSAIHYQQQQLGFEKTSRVFDYTSYAFDVAWSNILHTLTIGACLCIPSESERTSDISGSIDRLRANFVHLTPTVGRFLDPAALRGLKRVLFIGEALKATDVTRWEMSSAEVYNTYGPAECTVTSTVQRVHPGQCTVVETQTGDPSIGKGVGVLAWVVQPSAPDRLAAIGTVGELWLEGPIVGAGYLNNVEKTANAFVEDPKWLLNGAPGQVPGRHGRLYRTGDLVFYRDDGSLGFIGRKDAQVKINGQRMELGEVEYHVRQLLPADAVSQIVADVIIPDATQRETLAVFLVTSGDSEEDGLMRRTTPMIAALRRELSKILPSYMVPAAYIPLTKLPMTATGKTDRQKVRELGRAYTSPALSPFATHTSHSSVLTDTQKALREIWASLLGIEVDRITPNHSFAEIGGDSIKIMSLAMAIRKNFNINIGVPQLIGQHHSLCELSTMIDGMVHGQSVAEPKAIDLEREVDLLASRIGDDHAATAQTVFLTGSTGYLGTQILRHTLTRRAFDRVVVLVRGLHGQEGLDRVEQAARLAGWWQDSYASAIEVWSGDLSAERLGLNDSQWSALCGRPSMHGTVDAIIHNGAIVHWSTNYDNLKAVNVESTVQLLQAAMDSPFVKSFVYVSGGLITDSRTWTKDEEKEASGYDQTKYVSERLVSAAASKSRKQGTKFSVVKPGQIIGDVYTGVANADDFLWRVVLCATRLGARPMESESSWLSVSDVRHITETVLWHATGKSNDDFVNIRRGIWVNSFWAALEDQLHQPLRAISWDEWVELAKLDMAQEQELHPLWPVQHFLGALGTEITDNDRSEWEMQEVVAATRQNIEYLRKQGLTNTRAGYRQLQNGGVPTRTREMPPVIKV